MEKSNIEREVDIVCTTDSMISSFLYPYIEFFDKRGYKVRCFCSRTGDYFDRIQARGIDVTEIPFTRNPITVRNIKAYRLLKKEFKKNTPRCRYVFCHEPVGGVMGRLIAKYFSIPAIYMVHGFHFFKGAPIINWLLFYPIESMMAHFTDLLITINREDYGLASKRMKAQKTVYLPGVGIDTGYFRFDPSVRVEKREELGLADDDIAILSVGELNRNKNHIVIVEAMQKLKDPKIHFYIAGVGSEQDNLLKKASEYGLERNVHLLGYRNDCVELYSAADIFCFPSYREGLSVALLEAMACGLPVLASDIRGNRDLVVDEGGVLLDPSDIDSFTRTIKEYAQNKTLRESSGLYNSKVAENYSIKKVLSAFSEEINGLLQEPMNV